MDLLGYSKAEVIDALQTIHEICCNNMCSECPFNKRDECMVIHTTPEDWSIRSNLEEWKAFDQKGE